MRTNLFFNLDCQWQRRRSSALVPLPPHYQHNNQNYNQKQYDRASNNADDATSGQNTAFRWLKVLIASTYRNVVVANWSRKKRITIRDGDVSAEKLTISGGNGWWDRGSKREIINGFQRNNVL